MTSYRYFFTLLIIAAFNTAFSDDLPDKTNSKKNESQVVDQTTFKAEIERLKQISITPALSLSDVDNNRWEDSLTDETSYIGVEKERLNDIDLTPGYLKRSSKSQLWEDSLLAE